MRWFGYKTNLEAIVENKKPVTLLKESVFSEKHVQKFLEPKNGTSQHMELIMKKIMIGLLGVYLVTGCVALDGQPCEDLLEVKRQEQMCAKLRKQMNQKSHPQEALTAKQRYEQACINHRYYRDDYDTICKGDETPSGQK